MLLLCLLASGSESTCWQRYFLLYITGVSHTIQRRIKLRLHLTTVHYTRDRYRWEDASESAEEEETQLTRRRGRDRARRAAQSSQATKLSRL